MNKKIRIGALISGGGSNLQSIIESCEAGKINGKMVFVGSDNPNAGGLERARKYGIDAWVVNYRSIIQGFRKAPDSVKLPDDFDLQEVYSVCTRV